LKKFHFTLFTLVLVLVCTSGIGQSYGNLEFVENKGQWDEKVKFKGQMATGDFYIGKNGVSIVQHNTEDLKRISELSHGDEKHIYSSTTQKTSASSKSIVLRSHAYEVKFLGADNPTIIADKPLGSYNNYFIGDDPSKWAANCKVYQAVTYKNIYPDVDVRYYTDNGRLKYDIIVRPGADVSRIAMKYDGVDDLKVKNEELLIKTSVGEMKELSPYTYQVINGKKQEVGARFKVSGNTVRFQLDEYAKGTTLVIDPTLIFSTFSGSTADNWGYTATYGPDGSFYGGGIVFGAGFPVSTGAFQTTYGQGTSVDGIRPHDIGIIKFDPTGSTRIYATYIGGTGNEQPHSLIVDAQGNLVIAGRTTSANYPITVSSYGTGGGLWDIILTKLNSTGTALIGSRRIGGNGDDGVNISGKKGGEAATTTKRNYGDDARSEVILDNSGNIYLASCTQSTDFPVSPGAAQMTNGGAVGSRAQDGVVMKLSPNLANVFFSTYLGGSRDDAAFVLSLNPLNGNIFVAGATASLNFPGAVGGGRLYSGYQGGEVDGFVAILTNDGNLVKSTYVGTGGHDMVFGVQFDKFGFPYIMGTTSSVFPIINATFNSQPTGKQFISKLQPDLSAYVYSTNFGTAGFSPNISPTAFLVDRCENVYVSGWGGDLNNAPGNGTPGYQTGSTTTGLSTTSNAIQSKTDGSDFYFFVLEKNATKQLYGSFFGQDKGVGGEHVDGGTSRFDANGVIYQAMCANCGGGAPFPITPGVWSPTNRAYCNLAAVKIEMNFSGVRSGVQASINGVPRDTVGCVPLTVEFKDTIATGQFFLWNFGDGTPEIRTTVPASKHTFTAVGNYQVRLIAVDSTTCNISDTSYTNIRVGDDQAILNFTSAKLPPCQSTAYQFTNTSIAPPNKPFLGNKIFKWVFGDNSPPVITGSQTVTHTYAGTGTYKVWLVLLDTNYCNSPDSIFREIRISPNVKAAFETPPSGCAPYNAVFKNVSAGGQSFVWDFGDGTTSTLSTPPPHLYATPGTYTISLTAIDSSTCNIIDSSKFTIIVSGKPTAAFTFSPIPPQENTPVVFSNGSIGAVKYIWKFGDGDTLATTSIAPISHIYGSTGTFNACLIAINQFGCRDTVCQPVSAIIVPALDIPTAFTPNNDGVNDRIFVRGFGIARMTWRIFNRWGTLVYQSANQKEGWDGKYKGILQPKEVYTYVLDVEFSDKTKYQKKGDITLL
jgi:gliding motility-associated-like protein